MFTRNKEKNDANSTREERFKKVASRRTQEILHKLKLLGNCSNKANYSYADEQVRKIFSAIDKQIKETKIKFDGSLSGKEKFSLD